MPIVHQSRVLSLTISANINNNILFPAIKVSSPHCYTSQPSQNCNIFVPFNLKLPRLPAPKQSCECETADLVLAFINTGFAT